MPTASAEAAPLPNRPCAKENLRTRFMVVGRSDARRKGDGGLRVGKQTRGVELRLVAGNVGAARLRHEVERGRRPPRPCAASSPSLRTRRRSRPCRGSGLSWSVWVLTTIRSMISPRIMLLSKTRFTFGTLSTATNCGFQVTTAFMSGVAAKVSTISASDVLTIVTSLFGKARRLQRPRQQIVRDRELDQADASTLEISQAGSVLEDNAVVAVREVADDDGGSLDAGGGRDRQRVHVGHGTAIEGTGRVLVDRLDVVLDLDEFDRDAVLVRPFLHDAGLGRIGPWHPADIDRPAMRNDFLVAASAGAGDARTPRSRAVTTKSPSAVFRKVRIPILPLVRQATDAQELHSFMSPRAERIKPAGAHLHGGLRRRHGRRTSGAVRVDLPGPDGFDASDRRRW